MRLRTTKPPTLRVPVRIQPGQTTVVHLEGDWRPDRTFSEDQIVRLPNGKIAGWRAPHAF